jgi:large conductance mechanosensitive channel
MLKEFVAFLKSYGVIGLAIAVIIGGKLNELVGSILKAAAVDDIRKLSAGGILYGKVIGAGIDFLVVAGVVFMIAKLVLKEEKVAKK